MCTFKNLKEIWKTFKKKFEKTSCNPKLKKKKKHSFENWKLINSVFFCLPRLFFVVNCSFTPFSSPAKMYF